MEKSSAKTITAGVTSAEASNSVSSPFPETADIETSSEDYATRFAGPIGIWLLSVQEEVTLSMLKPYAGATILDVGGGHGQLTPALVTQGYSVTVFGSDSACKTRIQSLIDRGQCQFEVGNVLALPYPDNAFDVVISYRFLAHVTQWKAFLSELNRVANKAVIIDYPTVRSANYIAPLLFQLKKEVECNTRPFICYKEKELLNYLISLGLNPSDRCGQFFWPMVLHRMMKNPNFSTFLEMFTRRVGLNSLFGSPVILKLTKS